MQEYAQIIAAGQEPTPVEYLVPNAQEIIVTAVDAVFDGTGAAGDFIPTVELVSDGGKRISFAIASKVLAGGSAEVSFAPFLRGLADAQTLGQSAVLLANVVGTTVPTGTLTPIAWEAFETTDTSIFATLPNGAAGDTSFAVGNGGDQAVILMWNVAWHTGPAFDRWARLDPGPQPDPGVSNPLGGSALKSGAVATANPYDSGVYVQSTAQGLLPAFFTLNLFQTSGVNQKAFAIISALVVPASIANQVIYV